MAWGLRFLEEAAAISPGGRLAYGADIHGETQSRAWSDIMYPAGQFDTIKHRQMMAIAERTKSVIDATLFEGVPNFLEDQFFGGDAGEGLEDSLPTSAADNVVPIDQQRRNRHQAHAAPDDAGTATTGAPQDPRDRGEQHGPPRQHHDLGDRSSTGSSSRSLVLRARTAPSASRTSAPWPPTRAAAASTII